MNQVLIETEAVQPPITTTNKSLELIQKTRENFLSKLTNEERDSFYQEDLEKIETDDWYVKRFLLVRGRNADDAATMIYQCLKWRRSVNIRDITPRDFPADLFRISGMFLYRPDREGNLTVYFRVRFLYRIPELVDTVKKFSCYLMHQVDDATQGRGITGVVDFQGTGMRNADVDMLFYAITILRNYFPAGIKHILIIDLPWILRATWSMFKTLVPEKGKKILEFTTRKEVTKFIALENLPDFMNGSCDVPYKGDKVVPEGAVPTMEFCTKMLGLPLKDAERIYGVYKPILEQLDQGIPLSDDNKEE